MSERLDALFLQGEMKPFDALYSCTLLMTKVFFGQTYLFFANKLYSLRITTSICQPLG